MLYNITPYITCFVESYLVNLTEFHAEIVPKVV